MVILEESGQEEFTEQDIKDLIRRLENLWYKESDVVVGLSDYLSFKNIERILGSHLSESDLNSIIEQLEYIVSTSNTIRADAQYIIKILKKG